MVIDHSCCLHIGVATIGPQTGTHFCFKSLLIVLESFVFGDFFNFLKLF